MRNQQHTKFEQMVEEHKATIYSVCYMFADSKEMADDLFQDVLVNLWQGIGSFRGESTARSWVYKVSLNTCISAGRKKKIETVPLDVAPEVYNQASPEGRQNAQLHERITKLEKFERAIVLLWLEDMSYDEIASIVGISPQAVGVRLLRIKEKLKSL